MRLLVESYGDVRVFKDRSLIGLPRYIIESIDPEIPLTSQREAGDEDYYWVIIPETGNIKWEKGINLEIINNHLVH